MSRNGPILAIRVGAMGDLVQFSAVVAALADHHDQPVDVLTGGGPAAEVLAGMPEVARRFAMFHRRRPAWIAPDLRALARGLAARNYAHVYVFDRAPVVEQALALGGAVLHDGCRDTAARHALDSYAEILDRLDVGLPAAFLPRTVATAAEQAAARALLQRHGVPAGRRLLVVQPGNKRTLHPLHRFRPARDLKAWPAERWAATIAGAIDLEGGDLAVALVGAPPEWPVCEAIRGLLPGAARERTIDLSRDLPVRVLAGLLAGADGCIAVDTGPAHLAAALGCPTVVLFGPADPAAMAPRGPNGVAVVRSGAACSPCYGTARRDACRENVCMGRIPVADVLHAWSGLASPAQVRCA